MSEICFMSATDIVRKIRDKKLSCQEVMTAHLSQIERINPEVNAIVTQISPEQALAGARAADAAIAQGREVGLLHGLPMAHKDLVPTKDLRTTLGSPIFKDQIPDHDGLIVERLKNAGVITIGKTNTPEFGAGSQTFNEVFGETLNPYDTTKTCGGSSGGAAVALACGMIPIADGSDMGGSLRNPASFCNVVGFRTSPGRVPVWPAFTGWFPISVQGPMARTVKDVALMLSAIAGPDPRSPISIAESGSLFQGTLDRNFKNVKLAWSNNLGGLPVDPSVTKVLEGQRKAFCAGYDIGSLPTGRSEDPPEKLKILNPVESLFKTMIDFPFPVIAMINGVAFGAGCELALCCDIRIGADNIRIGMPPTKLGLVYPWSGLQRFIQVIGLKSTKEIFFTGRAYEGIRLKELGLVDYLIPGDKLESFTGRMAEEIAANAPLALKGTKRVLNLLFQASQFDNNNLKEAESITRASFLSEDLKEGQLAFLEKRGPLFKGR